MSGDRIMEGSKSHTFRRRHRKIASSVFRCVVVLIDIQINKPEITFKKLLRKGKKLFSTHQYAI